MFRIYIRHELRDTDSPHFYLALQLDNSFIAPIDATRNPRFDTTPIILHILFKAINGQAWTLPATRTPLLACIHR